MIKSVSISLFIFFAALFVISSCSNDSDESTSDSALVGVWNLSTVNGIDYSSQKIQLTHSQDLYTFVSPDCTESGSYSTSDKTITYTVTTVSGTVNMCDSVGTSVTRTYTIRPTTLTEIQEDGVILVFVK